MKYKEFTRQVGKAGLTVAGFARLIKRKKVSVTNYKGAEKMPDHLVVMVLLMAEMAENDLDFTAIIEKAGVREMKDRGGSFS